MVPILLKALYLLWRRLDLVHMSHKEILMSYVSVYNDMITKLCTLKIALDTMHSLWSERHPGKQHGTFWAGCVCWQLENRGQFGFC